MSAEMPAEMSRKIYAEMSAEMLFLTVAEMSRKYQRKEIWGSIFGFLMVFCFAPIHAHPQKTPWDLNNQVFGIGDVDF